MTQRMNLGAFLKRHGLADKTWDAAAALIAPTPSGPWIVGGAVRRLINGEPQSSDLDVAFASEAQLASLRDRLKASGFKQVRETEKHVELRGKVGDKDMPVQLLRAAYYTNAEAVLDSFDFTICMFAFDGTDLVCGPLSLWDLARKRLVLHKLTFGASTIRRLVKYTKQGFVFCQGTAVAILEAVVANPQSIAGDVSSVD